jgi:hypothetical protein
LLANLLKYKENLCSKNIGDTGRDRFLSFCGVFPSSLSALVTRFSMDTGMDTWLTMSILRGI